MLFQFGAADSDIVLSGQDLLSIVASLPPQNVTEEPQVPKETKLIYTSGCQDLRVGERATKRRRSAGTASVLEHSLQRGGRSDRLNDAAQAVDDDVPVPAGPMPKGWKVFYRVIGDGRRCECRRTSLTISNCVSSASPSWEICALPFNKFLSVADKAYESPYGRTYQSYAKAKLFWEQEKQSSRKASGLERGKGTSKRTEAEAAKDWPMPESLGSLLSWLRDATARGLTSVLQDTGFREAVLRARGITLDVRSTRAPMPALG